MPRKRVDAKHTPTKTSGTAARLEKELAEATKLRQSLARERKQVARERFRAVPRRGVIRPDWGYTADELTAIYGDYDQVRTILRALAKRECLCDEDFVKGCHVFLGKHVLEAHAKVARCLSPKFKLG